MEPAIPPAVTPQGAAALALLRRGGLVNGPLVVVTERHVPSLAQDLLSLADTVWLWKSDSVYGGQQRFSALPDSYYVVLDLREVTDSSNATQTFRAMVEQCAGWPCHSEYRIRVRRHDAGFVAEWVQGVSVE